MDDELEPQFSDYEDPELAADIAEAEFQAQQDLKVLSQQPRPRKRANPAEHASRVTECATLYAEGMGPRDIAWHAVREYGVKERQGYNIAKEALDLYRDQLNESLRGKLPELVARNAGRREHLYQLAVAEGDLAQARAILNDMEKSLGLSVDRVEVSDMREQAQGMSAEERRKLLQGMPGGLHAVK